MKKKKQPPAPPTYKVITADDAPLLSQLVNEAMAEGAWPQGGVSIAHYVFHDCEGREQTGFFYLQAVVFNGCPF